MIMLIPKNKRLVCRRLPEEQQAFFVPDAIRQIPNKSEVVAASEGSEYQPGTVVIHHQQAGVPVRAEDEDLIILKETDIYAIIK